MKNSTNAALSKQQCFANAPADMNGAEAMKRRLVEYRDMNREIENQIERLERLEEKMYSPSSPNLSGMPKAPSSVRDNFVDDIARKDELEKKIRKLISLRDSERKAIEGLTGKLRNPDERAVVCMRYIDSEEWDDIIAMLFGVSKESDDDYDNYKQRMFRLHRSAMSKMAQIQAVV